MLLTNVRDIRAVMFKFIFHIKKEPHTTHEHNHLLISSVNSMEDVSFIYTYTHTSTLRIQELCGHSSPLRTPECKMLKSLGHK